jgi:hypothetical protein
MDGTAIMVKLGMCPPRVAREPERQKSGRRQDRRASTGDWKTLAYGMLPFKIGSCRASLAPSGLIATVLDRPPFVIATPRQWR